MDKEYQPFGPEWEKELMKHSKKSLIAIYRLLAIKQSNTKTKIEIAEKIIGRLNAYCISQDSRRLGLPVCDEVAMAEMTDLVCKLLKQIK